VSSALREGGKDADRFEGSRVRRFGRCGFDGSIGSTVLDEPSNSITIELAEPLEPAPDEPSNRRTSEP